MFNQGGLATCQPDAEHIAAALRMVFDRLSIVPAFQYNFSTVISPWELHCFYLAAAVYNRLSVQPGLVVQTGETACRTTMKLLQDYRTGWKIAGELQHFPEILTPFVTDSFAQSPILNQASVIPKRQLQHPSVQPKIICP